MYFDPNKTIGALGTLIAAKWYKTRNPQHLLISLDSVDARRWMNLDDDGKRADMLGLTISDGKPILDILEVKAGEDASSCVQPFSRWQADRKTDQSTAEYLPIDRRHFWAKRIEASHLDSAPTRDITQSLLPPRILRT